MARMCVPRQTGVSKSENNSSMVGPVKEGDI
jgi:hypothetical protein